MTIKYLLVAASFLLLADGLNGRDDKKDDKQDLQGEWKISSMELSGRKLDDNTIKQMNNIVVKGSEWTGPSPKGAQMFKFTLDATKTPKQLDLTMVANGNTATWKGIYKLDGDTLTFCRTQGPMGNRPKAFKGGMNIALIVAKRADK
jgi:uncharacterized protein (TIGR03067 family)